VLFLETFDPVQMRYAGQEWRKLVDSVEQIARATGSVCLDNLSSLQGKANHNSLALRLHRCDQQ
jgi:hypothetical protein